MGKIDLAVTTRVGIVIIPRIAGILDSQECYAVLSERSSAAKTTYAGTCTVPLV